MSKVAELSANPVIKLYKNCITSQQQFNIMKLAKERLVEDTNSGFSWSLYLREKRDANLAILREIVMLAGNLSGLPWKLAEPVSLTKYTANQNYDLHYDSGFVTQGKKMKRAATFLLYLNSAHGGETIFPLSTNGSNVGHAPLQNQKPLLKDICCDEKVLKVVPEARSCLVFFNHLVNEKELGELNPRSIHGSCPVINGEKWIVQVWLHHEPWGSNVTDFW